MPSTRSRREPSQAAPQTPIRTRRTTAQPSIKQLTIHSFTPSTSFVIHEDNLPDPTQSSINQSNDVFEITEDIPEINPRARRLPMKQLNSNTVTTNQSINQSTDQSIKQRKPAKSATNNQSKQARVQPKRATREKENAVDNQTINQSINQSNESDEFSPSSSSSEEDYPAVRAAKVAAKKRAAPVIRKPISKRPKNVPRTFPEVSPALESIAQYFRDLDSQSFSSTLEVTAVPEIGALTGVPRDQWGKTSPPR